MELVYRLALFLHVVGVFVLIGGIGFATVCEWKIDGASTPDQLREWATLLARNGAVLGIAALVILASGFHMAHAIWGLTSPWVVAAMVGIVVFAASGPLVIRPAVLGAVEMAGAAGSITPDVRARLRAPGLRMIAGMRPAFLVWFAYLMTLKPGIVGVSIGTVLALIVGAGVVSLGAKRHQ